LNDSSRESIYHQPGLRRNSLSDRLLDELVSNACRVIPREVLYDKFFSDVQDPANALNRCISELRRKLEPDPSNPQYILTKREVGYKFKDYR
jgi:two-component system KDP operon response regulator KdpE